MRKSKAVFLIFSVILLGGLFFFNRSGNLLPFPLTEREKVRISLKKELIRREINLAQGPLWSQEAMSFIGFLSEGTKIIFSSELRADEQISSLQLILKKSTMITDEKKKIKVIDLRSPNPYVSLEDY